MKNILLIIKVLGISLFLGFFTSCSVFSPHRKPIFPGKHHRFSLIGFNDVASSSWWIKNGGTQGCRELR